MWVSVGRGRLRKDFVCQHERVDRWVLGIYYQHNFSAKHFKINNIRD